MNISDWSKCMYIDDDYVRYRNISIYDNNNTLIIDTFNNFTQMKEIFNIIVYCDEEESYTIAIIFCSVMILLCFFGCVCLCKKTPIILPTI